MTGERLFSLDALRGLDMILLTVIGPLVWAAQNSWSCFSVGFMGQFQHGWVGFTLWDIIMPLFIFMCGGAIPFALGRRMKEGRLSFWKHVLARVVLLWCLGGLVQGNWISLNPNLISPYSNTLQSIASGYLVVAVVMSLGSRMLMVAVPVVLVVIYTVLLSCGGDYSEFGNFAYKVDYVLLSMVLPAANKWVVKPSYYTWFLTSAMYAVMTFSGYCATWILMSVQDCWRKVMMLFAYGFVLLVVGFVSEIWIPCIKPIFTLSFTALAMGWCVIMLAILYVITDIWKFRLGSSCVLLFGQLALTAYFVSHFFHPVLNAFAHLVGDGLIACLPTAAQFIITTLEIAGLVVVMLIWRSFKEKTHGSTHNLRRSCKVNLLKNNTKGM